MPLQETSHHLRPAHRPMEQMSQIFTDACNRDKVGESRSRLPSGQSARAGGFSITGTAKTKEPEGR